MAIIRKIKVKDAEKFLNMLKRLDNETKFMLYEPGERKATAEGMRRKIESGIQNNNLVAVIEDNEEIYGFISADKGNANRIKHTAYVVTGICENYRGKGYGTKLFEALDQWAIKNKILRLELTVMTENTVAIKLYEKMGFKIEGTKEKSCLVDGKLVDEYYMAKIMKRD